MSNQNAASDDLAATQEFLVQAATLLHRLGAPSHRLERVMTRVSHSLGIAADFLYTPTALLVSFNGALSKTVLRRVEPSDTDLGKLYELDDALERLEDGQATLPETARRLSEIADRGRRYPVWLSLAVASLVSACATVFFGAGLFEVLFAAVMGGWVQAWGLWLKRVAPQENLLEVTSGFLCAAVALGLSASWPVFDDRLATLGALIILVPGLTFTMGMTELANRHLSAGVARLAWAAVVFLALTCGVALAWRLGSHFRPAEIRSIPLPGWVYYLALGLAPVLFAILFQARVREWPVIVTVAWIGFLAAASSSAWKGGEFGAFVGALSIGLASNLYARWWDRPAMVPQMPAVLMLVPGSLGFRSLTAFVEQDELVGLEFAFGMVLIAVALVGGLLVANLIVPPKRSL